ncbi:MAG TPA: fluoride efflux transporter CrcB [Hyphomonadaceae bacterium]|jgi:CrcB protein|nr:fluoride efflux transporter CrcB [Hyphomonadaceae bacterium]HPN05535.1 fluoride efflux transporter CrcB [Hyphomonadaceae bacterium]
MMRELFLSSVVFAGAGTGGVLRHLANRFIPMALPVSFPLSTFIVNVLGCFAMGVLASWFAFRGEASSQTLRLLLTTGVLGGFTTFSAFSLDAALLWERGAIAEAALYVSGSVVLSLIGVFGGLVLMRTILQ